MINQSRAMVSRAAAVSLGMALMSLALPVAALMPLPGRTTYGTATAPQNDYRLMVAALFVALLLATVSILVSARVLQRSVRWLVVGLATGGLLLSGYLLLGLIGTCGLGVLGGTCAP